MLASSSTIIFEIGTARERKSTIGPRIHRRDAYPWQQPHHYANAEVRQPSARSHALVPWSQSIWRLRAWPCGCIECLFQARFALCPPRCSHAAVSRFHFHRNRPLTIVRAGYTCTRSNVDCRGGSQGQFYQRYRLQLQGNQRYNSFGEPYNKAIYDATFSLNSLTRPSNRSVVEGPARCRPVRILGHYI
jgi:hypothetical protein